MKSMRLHIYIVLAIFVIGFIVGSFVDLSLSTAIFSRDNGFGLTIAAIGVLPGCMVFAVLGGCFLALSLHKDYKKVWKVVLFILTIIALVASIFFSGQEFFGENGFYNPSLDKWLGYVIAAPFAIGCGYLGYLMGRKSENPYLWIILLIAVAVAFIALVPGVTLIKSIFHRPRFRTVTLYEGIEFHSWWQRTSNYAELMQIYGVSKEEFKSFPSGHVGESSVLLVGAAFLPLINPKYQKYQLPFFYCGLAWTLLVAFTRILVGAHFLSDVSMGGLLMTLLLLIGNEVTIALNKKYHFAE